jgi:hypothetical protein
VRLPFVRAFLPPIGRVNEEVSRQSKPEKGERERELDLFRNSLYYIYWPHGL